MASPAVPGFGADALPGAARAGISARVQSVQGIPPRPGDAPRFLSCRCTLYAVAAGAPASAPPEPIAYRRCPGGVISDVDCPEFVGARCRFHDDRGGAPPTVVPRAEVLLLAHELAADYLTPRYGRRVRRLHASGSAVGDVLRGAELLAQAPPASGSVDRLAADAVPPRTRRLLVADAPVNIPADRAGRRPRAARPSTGREAHSS